MSDSIISNSDSSEISPPSGLSSAINETENNCKRNDISQSSNNNSSNNNNNNNQHHINKSLALEENDEVIEEFDFSDSDLGELIEPEAEPQPATVSVAEAKAEAEAEHAESDGNNNTPEENVVVELLFQAESNNGIVSMGAAVAADNNDIAPLANDKGIISSTTVHDDESESNSQDILSNNNSNSNNEEIIAIVAIDAADCAENQSSATVPAKLQLKPELEQTAAIALTSCPMTPRRIVDVETPTEPVAFFHSKSDNAGVSNDSNEMQNESLDCPNDEDPDEELLVQFLGEANRIAEARLAARRQARAEAREIRMRELERQQKEQEQNADRVFDMHTASGLDPLARSRLATGIGSSPVSGLLTSTRGSSMSSRRSSEDSLEEEGRSLRDIRHELKDVEERFRKAMIANAQLDNERASQTYQIQLLKDKVEEMEESYAQLQREFKEKSRDYNALKRNLDKLSEELTLVQGQLNERDTLIAEQGLVIVAVENSDGSDAKRALVSVESAQVLSSVQGSLDVRLKKFNEEKQELYAEVQQLREELESFKTQGKGRGNSTNGPLGTDEDYEAQREANKIISDFKYKLQKAEQEIASLQASLARSETQVIRYKSTAEAAEKAEAELKIERRKLQRENREAMERLEELETSNNHLLKRLDKLKNAKSALLKDL